MGCTYIDTFSKGSAYQTRDKLNTILYFKQRVHPSLFPRTYLGTHLD